MLLSAALTLVFVELLPQGLFVKFGLGICGRMVWFVKLIEILLWIPSLPARLLVYFLFRDNPRNHIIYDNKKLLKLIELHSRDAKRDGELDPLAVSIMRGAIHLQSNVCADIVKDISRVKMLDIAQVLDPTTIQRIIDWGYAKIPVFDLENNGDGREIGRVASDTVGVGGVLDDLAILKIIGYLDAKKLAVTEITEGLKVQDLELKHLPLVPSDYRIYDLLHLFQEKYCRMAVVIKSKTIYKCQTDVDLLKVSRVRHPRNKIDDENSSGISEPYPSSISWTDTSSLHSRLEPLGIIAFDDIMQQFLKNISYSGGSIHEGGMSYSGSSTQVVDGASTNSISAMSDSSIIYPLTPTNSAFSSSGRRSRFPSLNRRRVGLYKRSATSVHDIEGPKVDTARSGLRGLFDSALRRVDSHLKGRRNEELPLHHMNTGQTAGTSTLQAPSSLWETTTESLELTSPATTAIYEQGAASMNDPSTSNNENA